MTEPRPPRSPRCTDDRGVAAAFVAVGIIMLLAIGAFTVDLGRAWSTRRQLITSTDAAALAAAQDYTFGTADGCTDAAPDYLADNYSGAALAGCDVDHTSDRSGHVTVDAEITIDHFFASAVGLTSSTVGATTTAHWGQPSSVTGLRPIGLCIDVVLTGLSPPMTPGNGVTYRINYGKGSQPEACGGAAVPGNWGLIDFNAGANSNSDTSSWVLNGYPGSVTTGLWYEGDTGAFSNSLNSELNFVRTLESFDIPIFQAVTGNGANAEFLIVAFAKVRLIDFRANGNAASRYLDVQFVEGLSQGTVAGGDTGPDFGVRAIEICSVLPGELDGCV